MRSLVWGLLFTLGAVASAVPEEPYAWPLELPRVLTSSFAEYRPGRFHMGIDLRTGPIGKPVFAATDGYVARLRCSPYGYGKAVYLQLDDGNTAVYAHLDDFAPRLREYVQRAQHDRESYTVDLYPDPNQFRVNRGDLIALSGQTGIGVPHLHYEIRDRTGAPINPRQLGITWPDSTRPLIRKAVVVPVDPNATVNFDLHPVVLDVTSAGSGAYRTEPVFVDGPVAFGIDVIDPANGGSTRLGIHRATVAAGDTPVFELLHERVSYGPDRGGAVAYHPYLRDKGRFLMLWRWPDNRAEIFAHASADGSYSLDREAATIEIRVADVNGNEATLTIPVREAKRSLDAPPPGSPSQQGDVSFTTYGGWIVATVEFSEQEPVAPTLAVRDNDSMERIEMKRVTHRRFSAAYAPVARIADLTAFVEHPDVAAVEERFAVVKRGAPSTLHRFGSMLIRTQPDSPFGAMTLRATPAAVTGAEELRTTGIAFDLWPAETPVDEPLRMSLPMPTDAVSNRLGIYRKDRRGNWNYQTTRIVNGRLEADVDEFGLYAVLEDTMPPRVTIHRPAEGEEFVSARPSIRVEIDDAGSGIADYRATYNGDWLLMEYDPERKLLLWEQDEILPEGPGEIVVTVSDEAGNATIRRVTASLPPGVR